jgi:Zn finger protein HypA/HybF involved in hydrogenase expression
MHEAGLAAAIVDAIRASGPIDSDGRVRLLVSGGHAAPGDFDDSLRLHLRGLAPELEPWIEIEHVAVDRLCVVCGESFRSIAIEDPCPMCGGSAIPMPVPERVDIERVRSIAGD